VASASAPTPVHRRHVAPSASLLWIAALVCMIIVAAGVIVLAVSGVFDGSSASTTVTGSGVATTQARHVAAFTKLDLAGSNNVKVVIGSRQSVFVNADDNLLRRVTTRVEGGRLVIETAGTFTTRNPMSVAITVPSLEAIVLSGGGTIVARNIHSRRLTVELSGSGLLRARGTVTRLDVALSGSGDAQLGQLVARDARAVVSGAGQIVLTATRTLHAAVPGRGAIVYGGNPGHVTRSITGTGAITKR
jgi:hypothetical protein